MKKLEKNKKIQFKWECISEIGASFEDIQKTYRAKVIGGWLIREQFSSIGGLNEDYTNIFITFLSDEDHEWEVD